MKRLKQDEVELYFKQEGYELLSIYKNNRTPLVLKCPQGHIFDTMTFWSFKKGCRCPVCSRKIKLTYEFVKSEFEKEGYKLISDKYLNANSKLLVECPLGHKWEVTYGHFYDGKRCGICANNKKLDYNYIFEKFKERGYELLSKSYKNAQSRLVVKCPNGHITNTITWNNFKRGQGCKMCLEKSNGENIIETFLLKQNIKYKREYRFDDCKYKYRLPFDFYLPEYNTCVEYDGKQHYEPIDYFGGEKAFKETKKRDDVKNNYCQKNNIKLIRIPYWEFDNIENILEKELL